MTIQKRKRKKRSIQLKDKSLSMLLMKRQRRHTNTKRRLSVQLVRNQLSSHLLWLVRPVPQDLFKVSKDKSEEDMMTLIEAVEDIEDVANSEATIKLENTEEATKSLIEEDRSGRIAPDIMLEAKDTKENKNSHSKKKELLQLEMTKIQTITSAWWEAAKEVDIVEDTEVEEVATENMMKILNNLKEPKLVVRFRKELLQKVDTEVVTVEEEVAVVIAETM